MFDFGGRLIAAITLVALVVGGCAPSTMRGQEL